MNSYLNMIDEEFQSLGADTPKQQYEKLLKLKTENIELHSKVRQAETLLTGLIKTPGLEALQTILRANYCTIVGKEYDGPDASI